MKEFTYFLKFEDGTNFLSPDVRVNDPMWATEYSDKPIRELYFRVGNLLFGMQGFEKYNFFVEASESFGSGKKDTRLEKLFFCGAKAGRVVMYQIDFQTQTIQKSVWPEGREYYGNPTRGWRPGLFDREPQTGYEELK
jgi:hypothetical protein